MLVALSQGVEIAGISTSERKIPDVLALSSVMSLVFVNLYFLDDSLISYIGNYVRALTEAESELRPGKWKILNWDSSEQAKQLVSRVLPNRYLAQFTAFAIIPTILVVWRMANFASWGTFQIIEVVSHSVVLAWICYMVLRGYLDRRKAYYAQRLRHDAFPTKPYPVLESKEQGVDTHSHKV